MEKLINISLLVIPLLLYSVGVQAQMDAGTLEVADVAHNAPDYSPFVDRIDAHVVSMAPATIKIIRENLVL